MKVYAGRSVERNFQPNGRLEGRTARSIVNHRKNRNQDRCHTRRVILEVSLRERKGLRGHLSELFRPR